MIRLKPSPLLACLLLALSAPAFALQIVDAREGETTFAKISQKEVTRIAFERGRVRKITGNANEFLIEKDEERGQIFIRPTQPDATKPINLFLTSDRGTVGLLLQPTDIPSDSIVIREARVPGANASTAPRSAAHVRALKNLLLVMAGDELPDDMEMREIGQDLALWAGARLTLQRAWMGAGLVGEKFQLANAGTEPLALSERDLFKPGVMAVSLEQANLRPGEATNLFVIRERRPNE